MILSFLNSLRCILLIVICLLGLLYNIRQYVEYKRLNFFLIFLGILTVMFFVLYPIIGCTKCGTGYFLSRGLYRCPVYAKSAAEENKTFTKKNYSIEYQPVHPHELKKGLAKIGKWGPKGYSHPIEWIVIKDLGGSYLLLSKKILKLGAYKSKDKTGKDSNEIKEWLENVFYNQAFSDNEKKFIENKPFLLSMDDADAYVKQGGKLEAGGEDYAGDNTLFGANKSWWWLAENGTDTAPIVNKKGKIKKSGKKVYRENGGIRPAIIYRPYKIIEFGPLIWAVLNEEKDGTILIMSMHSVDIRQFHDTKALSGWTDSNLRKWLNEDFLNEYFSYAEREALIPNAHKVLDNSSDKLYIPYETMLKTYLECVNNDFRGGSGKEVPYGIWLIPDEYQGFRQGYSLVFGKDGKNEKSLIESDSPMPVYVVAHYNPDKYQQGLIIENELKAQREREERERQAQREREEQERQAQREKEEQGRKILEGYNKGDIVSFGNYHYYPKGKKKSLEWIILDKYSPNSLLMITRQAIDIVKYNNNYEKVKWKNSSIKKWLNVSFFKKAFSSDEQSAIMPLPNDILSLQNNEMKEAHNDQSVNKNMVSMLSKAETELFFGKKTQRQASITPYAKKKKNSPDKMALWWLRFDGSADILPVVAMDGNTDGMTLPSDCLGVAVRPVILIDISAASANSLIKNISAEKRKEAEEKNVEQILTVITNPVTTSPTVIEDPIEKVLRIFWKILKIFWKILKISGIVLGFIIVIGAFQALKDDNFAEGIVGLVIGGGIIWLLW